MKLNILTLKVILIMLATSTIGCNKTSNTEEGSLPLSLNCTVCSFMEGASNNSNNNDIYLIKGIVLDKIEYGLKIRLVEDLKGNFPENVNTFIVWGGNDRTASYERSDNLSIYNKQDALIMLLISIRDLSVVWFNPNVEKQEDYSTVICTKSVLKLSNGYVTGNIFDYYGVEQQTIPYDDFQKKLNELLTIKTD